MSLGDCPNRGSKDLKTWDVQAEKSRTPAKPGYNWGLAAERKSDRVE
jgi:hypothetical protein